MNAILNPLVEGEICSRIKAQMESSKKIAVSALSDAAFPCAVESLREDAQVSLVITYSEEQAEALRSQFRFFEKQTYVFPSKDVLFYSADVRGNLMDRKRVEIAGCLSEHKSMVLIASGEVLLERLPSFAAFMRSILRIKKGETVDLGDLRLRLSDLGYRACDTVAEQGDYSIRGGIIDLYPMSEDCPYRMELWGDEIDSIRSFDVESQRSIEEVDGLKIYPTSLLVVSDDAVAAGVKAMTKDGKAQTEALKDQGSREAAGRLKNLLEELKESLLSYHDYSNLEVLLPYVCPETEDLLSWLPKDTRIYVDEPSKVLDTMEIYGKEYQESMESRLNGGYILPLQKELLKDAGEAFEGLEAFPTTYFCANGNLPKSLKGLTQVDWPAKSVASYHNQFQLLVKNVQNWKKKGYRVLLLCSSATRAKRIASELEDYEVYGFFSDDPARTLKDGEVMTAAGRLSRGFVFEDERLAVVSETDIFPAEEIKRRKKRKKSKEFDEIKSFADLSVGDYVVHENHGIGIYRGIENVEVDKIAKDYLVIEYKNDSKLYILASQLDVIQKWGSKDGPKPKIDKLGGVAWTNTKTKVKGHVAGVAKDLVRLYAIRQSREGYAYSPDTPWQREFEDAFPYDETEDQLQAIRETKEDMESSHIMDRLICGDVGYGKTEVALRAAFKAVQDGKQVAYLVPTTILAQQHFATFLERMEGFPVTVRMLSRFCTAGEQKKILSGLAEGTVDIVIGTHRLLSKDLKYKDLGLLIIDEEQRFGVAHKEKIKQMKKDVDVLTLTATPIPRTLHMSLVGIRSMSLLNEPPVDRREIQTYVMEYNPELVKEAVKRELARNGQVYYVYNRVHNIEEVATELEVLLPEARIAFAHGQMRERDLETIMYQFINHEIDVLVTTTIIETGLDIANVNTIIIQDAENFGLSQLYQLRGRVGRSNRRASAFLMYRKDKILKETAEKRLEAIREFTDLGSGYRIALRDLEIRGAGNLLGEDQSGHMEAVGYDLYCKMLNDAIRGELGEAPEETFETTIDLPMDAFIPATYVKNEFTKLDLYKRIAAIASQEEYDDMREELSDRFGALPTSVENLLMVALVKAKAHDAYISDISKRGEEIRFAMYPKARVRTEEIDAFMKSYKHKMRMQMGGTPTFILSTKAVSKEDVLSAVHRVTEGIMGLIDTEKSSTMEQV